MSVSLHEHVEGNVWCACGVSHSQGRTPTKEKKGFRGLEKGQLLALH